jgi:RimJ/RimL family protein N-acetyltransferase
MTVFLAPLQYVTPTFTLRCFQAGDGAAYADALNSSHEHLGEFLEWGRTPKSLTDAEIVVRQRCAEYLRNNDFSLGIFTPDGSQMLGATGYHLWEGSLDSDRAELSMWIRSSAAGQGLGTAVLNAMIEWGFTEWRWTRLSWRNDVANTRSQRTAERAGLVLEGVLRGFLTRYGYEDKQDTHYYAIMKNDWLRERTP